MMPEYPIQLIRNINPTQRPRTHAPSPPRHPSASPSLSAKSSPLLSLPGELRNKIYTYCIPPPTSIANKADAAAIWIGHSTYPYHLSFSTPTKIPIFYMPSAYPYPKYNCPDDPNNPYNASYIYGPIPSPPPRQPTYSLSILATCKQIYMEAAPMVYSKQIVFTDSHALYQFVEDLSPGTAKLLRHVEIRRWGGSREVKRQRWKGHDALNVLAAKGATEIERLHFTSYRSNKAFQRQGQILRRRVKRG